MIQIKTIEVVDSFYDLDIAARYAHDPDRIAKGITDVFANSGLEIVDFGSEAHKTLKKRYGRVLDQIRSNKRHGKTRHNNFDSEKLFFRASEFPNLCKKDVPKR